MPVDRFSSAGAGHHRIVQLQRLDDRLQPLAQVRGRRIPLRRLLGQAAQNDAFKLDGQVRHDLPQRRRLGKLDRPDALHLLRVGPMKRMPAAGHLVQDQPDGKDVRLHAGLARNELLRRHVGNRPAACRIGRAHQRRLHRLHRHRGVEVQVFALQLPRQPEVQYLDQAAIGQHDVGGLQVAMEYPQPMRRRQSVGDLHPARKHQLRVCRPFFDDLVEALAGNVLHHDVRFAVRLADLIDRADIGMVDDGRQPRLAQLRGPHLLLGLRTALEQLQHDRPLQQRVVGQKHHPAAARTDLA
jgi:hypothetical protein